MTTEEMLRIEQVALARIKCHRKELRMSETEMGKIAFENARHAQTKVSRLYNPMPNTGKTARPTLGEWLAMCYALGIEPLNELKAILQE